MTPELPKQPPPTAIDYLDDLVSVSSHSAKNPAGHGGIQTHAGGSVLHDTGKPPTFRTTRNFYTRDEMGYPDGGAASGQKGYNDVGNSETFRYKYLRCYLCSSDEHLMRNCSQRRDEAGRDLRRSNGFKEFLRYNDEKEREVKAERAMEDRRLVEDRLAEDRLIAERRRMEDRGREDRRKEEDARRKARGTEFLYHFRR